MIEADKKKELVLIGDSAVDFFTHGRNFSQFAYQVDGNDLVLIAEDSSSIRVKDFDFEEAKIDKSLTGEDLKQAFLDNNLYFSDHDADKFVFSNGGGYLDYENEGIGDNFDFSRLVEDIKPVEEADTDDITLLDFSEKLFANVDDAKIVDELVVPIALSSIAEDYILDEVSEDVIMSELLEGIVGQDSQATTSLESHIREDLGDLAFLSDNYQLFDAAYNTDLLASQNDMAYMG